MTKSAKKAQTPCNCAAYSILAWNETNQDWDTSATTGCPGTLTTRDFAPGHDAKLKGFLIRAGVANQEVSDNQGITAPAERMADRFGFGHMVRTGIANGKADRDEKSMKRQLRAWKAEQRNDRENDKVERKLAAQTHDGNQARKARELAALVAAEEAKHAAEQAAIVVPEPEWDDEPQVVKAKIGRWTYEGTVADGEFTYTNGKGEATSTTKFTLI